MATAPSTQPTASTFSVTPNRLIDTGTAFSVKADTVFTEYPVVVGSQNTLAGWQNTTAQQVYDNAVESNTSASNAATSETNASNSAQLAQSTANFKGKWSTATGSGTVGDSYSHNGKTWRVEVAIADLTLSEPSSSNAEWQAVDPVNMGNVRAGLINDGALCELFVRNKVVKKISDSLSFSRSGIATYVDHYTALRTAQIDEPREERKGFLIEGSSTNEFLYSEDFSNAYWSKLNITTSNPADPLDPVDGVQRLQEDTSTGQRRLRRSTVPVTVDIPLTFSCLVKPDAGREGVTLVMQGGGSYEVDFNLLTSTASGSITAPATNGSNKIEKLGNGWFRLQITATLDSVSNADCLSFFSNDPNDGNATYTGNGTSGILVKYLQLEELPFATSYIKTTTTTQSRSADIVTVPQLNNISAIPYSISVDFNSFGVKDTNAKLWDGFGAESYINVSGKAFLDSGDRADLLAESGSSNLDVNTTVGVVDDVSTTLYVNGKNQVVSSGAETAQSDGTGTFYIGNSSAGNRPFCGHLSNIRIYDFALNADEAIYISRKA